MTRLLSLLLLLSACGPQRMLDVPDASTQAPDLIQTADAGLPADAGLTGFPCDVREILQAHCARCHAGQQPQIPHFSTRAHLFEETEGIKRGLEMMGRLGPDTLEPMPPYGVRPIPTQTHRLTLGAWVDAGMPPGECGPLMPR